MIRIRFNPDACGQVGNSNISRLALIFFLLNVSDPRRNP